ncbi:type I polyketide synthase [Streptomyces radicis]|uniref:Acyltransferase domain-containing protein n=1 Tax=Streptomyces radicis TaxID=1750517 RepID=A0A3A9W674_9ACTN|nr:type I polyketide synthase [Streptomyces radicis]RKN08360.1 acyltransferase domain-containing protein [Streptomyces radicis]RKN21604.1 acyltransferase domain-containing protein [Streptomyces radicis]
MTHHEQAPIAVVGMACRLPGATTPAEFWRLLREGVDAVGEIPEARRPHAEGLTHAALLDRVDAFDPEFFGISPREAAATDPQHRLMLELAWEALENAGIVPADLRESDTAVFASAIWDDYAELTARRGESALTHHTFAGTRRAMLANRVSYALRLTGPSLTVDTGQSSSLVAVHLACESLRRGEATTALVGGVNLLLAPGSSATSARMGALSPTGRCHTFDAEADGYVRGEGGAVLVLKPLAQARADGDPVHGVILGSAVNNDGGGDSLAAPRRATQEEVLRRAHRAAGTDPADVQYVELHGTGTPTGDPVEAAALGAVVGAAHPADAPLRVGSAKTNVGHLEGAAGIVGLLKTVLSLRHRELPPSLHHRAPHPDIPLDALGLRVHTAPGPWPDPERQLLAGVSSFGLGGTNCHVVVAEPGPAEDDEGAERPNTAADAVLPWTLSGRDAAALRAQAERLHRDLVDHPGATPADIGLSLATTRTAFPHRAVLVGAGRDRLLDALAALAHDEPAADLVAGVARADRGPVFVFPGQGGQWTGMAVELAERAPVFAAALDDCARALGRWTDWDLRTELSGDLARVDVVQPALWAVMVALARLWESYGVTPAAVVGHSQGEIAAAVVAGALSLDDGAAVVALRSRLIAGRLAGLGGMASVAMPADELEKRLGEWGGGLSVAAVNSPSSTVVAGDPGALDALTAQLEAEGTRVRRVPVDYASHSAQVDVIGPELAAALGDITPRRGRVPLHSTVTGEPLEGPELDAAYWVANLRRTVRFSDAVRALVERGHTTFVEVGPHPVLCSSVVETADAIGVEATATGSLRRDDGGPRRFLTGVGQAWAWGVQVAWRAAFEGLGARRVELPPYAFRRGAHWLPPGDAVPKETPRRPTPEAPSNDPIAAPRALDDLARHTPERRRRRVLDLVSRHTAAVLGHADAGRVAADTTFKDAGFDSHMSVELRDRLNAATGAALPTAVIYQHPTPGQLAGHLHGELFAADEGPSATGVLRDLDRLRDDLLALPEAPGDRAAVASRLRALLGEFEATAPATETSPVAWDGTPGDGAGPLVDDAMFALIEEELRTE